MNKSKPVRLWAVEVVGPRSCWMSHDTISRTQRGAISLYDRTWPFPGEFKNRLKLGLVRCIRVEVRPL